MDENWGYPHDLGNLQMGNGDLGDWSLRLLRLDLQMPSYDAFCAPGAGAMAFCCKHMIWRFPFNGGIIQR